MLLVIPCFSGAQSFNKGDVTIGLNLDLGAYATAGRDPVSGIKTRDGAVCSMFPLMAEYAFKDRWGLELQYRPVNYVNDNDSSSSSNFDLSAGINYHTIITNYFNLQFGILMGLSAFRYINTVTGSDYRAGGTQILIDAGANLFTGKNFGFNIHLAFNRLSYPNGRIREPDGRTAAYRIELNGVNIGVGMRYRF